MLMLLYQILGAVALVALILLAPVAPGLRRGLAQRLGLRPRGSGPGEGSGAPAETIWIHAASVGEVRAAEPLVEGLRRDRPAANILVSTFTPSGRSIAERTLAAGEPRVRCLLLPFDWGWIPGRVIRRERPSLFVLLETELWPVLLQALRRRGVPVLIANGRISPRSEGRYRAIGGLLRPALAAITAALARTPDDARRFESVGLPAARISVAGNLKHARRPLPGGDPAGEGRRDAIRSRLGAREGRPVIVAGSVRGHEGPLVLEAFRRLLAEDASLLLVLAPRHPGRFDTAPLRAWPGAWVRWSAAPACVTRETAVVLLDTLGELADFYAAATIALIGGTWSDRGGHNLLEPAFHGVPVVFGEDFRHFDEEGRALIAAGGGFPAAGVDGIRDQCSRLLRDPVLRAAAGLRAAQVAQSFGGAVERVLGKIAEILDAPRGRAA